LIDRLLDVVDDVFDKKYISILEHRDFNYAIFTVKTTMTKFAAEKLIFSDLLAGFNKLKEAVVDIVKSAE
jgi:hypothetical protein